MNGCETLKEVYHIADPSEYELRLHFETFPLNNIDSFRIIFSVLSSGKQRKQ